MSAKLKLYVTRIDFVLKVKRGLETGKLTLVPKKRKK